MRKIWVIWWKYFDGSGGELVRGYADRARAQADLELLDLAEGKQFYMNELELVSSKPGPRSGHRAKQWSKAEAQASMKPIYCEETGCLDYRAGYSVFCEYHEAKHIDELAQQGSQ